MTAQGDVIGGYKLIASRGAGGMGSVWEARAPDGSLVALKLMHQHLADDPSLVERFRREYTVGRKVSHPNLIAMRDSGTFSGMPFLVMDLAPGKSLRKLVDKNAPFFLEWEAATVGAQVADAVEALHGAGVIHRDLKSSNIMVDRDLNVKVIDYGIARLEGEMTLTPSHSFIGSAEYTGPEPYFDRPVGPKADVYSLGIVLYEMIVGRVPFRSDRYTDTLRMHSELPVPRISDHMAMVSDQFDNLVHQMLQKQPNNRPTPGQVAAACRSVLMMHGRSQPSRRQVSPERPAPRPVSPESRRSPSNGQARPLQAPPSHPGSRVQQMRDGSAPGSQGRAQTVVFAVCLAVGLAAVVVVGLVIAVAAT